MKAARTSWLRVALVVAWVGGCLALALVGGVPERLPGVALGSSVLLVLERAVIIAVCSGRTVLVLLAAWHGHLLGCRELMLPLKQR